MKIGVMKIGVMKIGVTNLCVIGGNKKRQQSMIAVSVGSTTYKSDW